MLQLEKGENPLRALAVAGQSVERFSTRAFDLFVFPESVKSFSAIRGDVPLPRELSPTESVRYRDALVNEHNFLTIKLGKKLPNLPEPRDVERLHRYFQEQREGKLTLRDIQLTGAGLTATWGVGPYPAYRLFGVSRIPALAAFGANVGSSVLVTTADEYVVLQHRSNRNDLYKGTVAASAAGLVVAPRADDSGRVDILRYTQATLLRESVEEIGLRERGVATVNLSSIIMGKDTVHHEIPFRVTSAQDAAQMLDGVRKNNFQDSLVAFREAVVAVRVTPESLAKLLTESRCPVPDTHAAMFAEEWLRLRLRGAAPQEVYREFERLLDGMDQQNARINAMCGGRYDPSRTLEEQGLPSLPMELKRLFGDEFLYAEPDGGPAVK